MFWFHHRNFLLDLATWNRINTNAKSKKKSINLNKNVITYLIHFKTRNIRQTFQTLPIPISWFLQILFSFPFLFRKRNACEQLLLLPSTFVHLGNISINFSASSLKISYLRSVVSSQNKSLHKLIKSLWFNTQNNITSSGFSSISFINVLI